MKEEKVSKVLYPDFFNSDYINAYIEAFFIVQKY